jgi:hypothetical protein
MLGSPGAGSKLWEAEHRAISESGKYRRQVVASAILKAGRGESASRESG